MHWWEETAARIHRTATAANGAQNLWQRLCQAGLDPDLSYLPAYDLAALQALCADLVKLVDGLLEAADGDRAAWRRHALVLLRWSRRAEGWAQATAPAMNRLLDSLDLEPSELAEREEAAEALQAGHDPLPAEQAKLDGRYRHWHLLYERLDLKLSSMGIEEQTGRALARTLARLYEECLVTFRLLAGLGREASPRYGATVRLLLQINTSWHFDLGPYVLGPGQARPDGVSAIGLPSWLLLALREAD
ncbi:hypothetical protein J2Z79_000132 [Symbiobacterium terraclitae]|uniref:Uncharacterized protein n=1 Tax=Symbiobacterium terraclitae TaxID=557451 RepID=A0ABS4JQM4_9FIRM|nr:hypothetical protein [Symbiobacterium terraclitae]MBP2016759.1 hypothetical protein [Symbiobacterium terraclitae]